MLLGRAIPAWRGSGYFQTKVARRDLRKYISPGSHQTLAIASRLSSGCLAAGCRRPALAVPGTVMRRLPSLYLEVIGSSSGSFSAPRTGQTSPGKGAAHSLSPNLLGNKLDRGKPPLDSSPWPVYISMCSWQAQLSGPSERFSRVALGIGGQGP